MKVFELEKLMQRNAAATRPFKQAGTLYEKMILLCMVLDTIAYTEQLTHEELYVLIDDIKPQIKAVNEMMGPLGILEDET